MKTNIINGSEVSTFLITMKLSIILHERHQYKLVAASLESPIPIIYWEVMLATDLSNLPDYAFTALQNDNFQWADIISGWGAANSQPWVEVYGRVGFLNITFKKTPCLPGIIPEVILPAVSSHELNNNQAPKISVNIPFNCSKPTSRVYWGISLQPPSEGNYNPQPLPDLGGPGRLPVNPTSTASGIAIELTDANGTNLNLIDNSNVNAHPDNSNGWHYLGDASYKTSYAGNVLLNAQVVPVAGQQVVPGDFTATAWFIMEFR